MRRHRQGNRPLTELNITNLLDTTLVLLLAFMIVTPSLKHGIDLELPVVEGGKSIEADAKKTIAITIQKKQFDGGSDRILVDDSWVSLDELKDLLAKKRAVNPDLDVVIEADKDVSYGVFAQALGVVKELGISNVGLPTEVRPTESKTGDGDRTKDAKRK